jgi:cobalt-zinc-cadmium efflux system membrane fusion protein
MEQNQRRNWNFFGIICVALALVLGLGLGAYLHSRYVRTHAYQTASAPTVNTETPEEADVTSDVAHISAEAQKEVGIAVEPVQIRNLQDILVATGTVSEDPIRVAHIRPLARGLIEKSYVRLGDRVSKGDSLIEYDNIELGIAIGEYLGAQAELQRSLTDLEVKRTILERGKEMLKVGAIARTTYDLREAEFKDAEAKCSGSRAAVEKVEAQIHRFGWSDQDLANLLAQQKTGHTVTHSIMRAPFSGIITEYHASVGEAVEPSTELLSISDLSTLWVLADVFEKDLSQVKVGQSVRVRVTSYPGNVFLGKITYVADTIEPITRTAKVRCVVQNSNELLKLAMFATIDIPMDRINSVLAVPDSAIQQIEGKSVVFIRTSATEFKRRDVQTGITSSGYTEIRSGLNAGDLVAGQGSFVVKTAFLRNLIGEDE